MVVGAEEVDPSVMSRLIWLEMVTWLDAKDGNLVGCKITLPWQRPKYADPAASALRALFCHLKSQDS